MFNYYYHGVVMRKISIRLLFLFFVVTFSFNCFAQVSSLVQNNAENGHAEAQFQVGNSYFEKGNFKEAVKWLELSAEQDNVEAQTLLATFYINGMGVIKDVPKAVDLYNAAAEQNHDIAQAMLGHLYFNFDGVEQDLVKAYKWFYIAFYDTEDAPIRDIVRKKMTSVQLEKAIEEAETWMDSHPK